MPRVSSMQSNASENDFDGLGKYIYMQLTLDVNNSDYS